MGACSAKSVGLICGPALPIIRILRDTFLSSNLLFIFFFALPPFLLYLFSIFIYLYITYTFFFHISRAPKSIVENFKNAEKQKNKKICIPRAPTWRKLPSVNIPFPIFSCTFFLSFHFHLTIFGNSFYVHKNSSTLDGWKEVSQFI